MTSHDTMEDAPQSTERKPAITVTQLMATALAAITAAFLGSFIGITGTIVGAGIASVISSVASALYQKSLERTRHRVRSTVSQVRTRTRVDRPTGTEPAGVEVSSPSAAPSADRKRLRWALVVGLTVLAFVVGMGVVTGIELLRGGPISGGDNGTTVGGLLGQPTQRSTSTTPTPSPSTSNPSTSGSTAPSTTTGPPTTSTGPTRTTSPTTTPSTPTPSRPPASGVAGLPTFAG
jgi:hypothetical protein